MKKTVLAALLLLHAFTAWSQKYTPKFRDLDLASGLTVQDVPALMDYLDMKQSATSPTTYRGKILTFEYDVTYKALDNQLVYELQYTYDKHTDAYLELTDEKAADFILDRYKLNFADMHTQFGPPTYSVKKMLPPYTDADFKNPARLLKAIQEKKLQCNAIWISEQYKGTAWRNEATFELAVVTGKDMRMEATITNVEVLKLKTQPNAKVPLTKKQLTSYVATHSEAENFDAIITTFTTFPPTKSREFAVLGSAYQKTQQLDKAEATFLQCLAINPDQPETLYNLATLYFNRAATASGTTTDEQQRAALMKPHLLKALPYFQKSLEIAPNDAGVRKGLYLTYKYLGQTAEAEKYKAQ
jgi:tetratricopeptide (TPR) repeat protein